MEGSMAIYSQGQGNAEPFAGYGDLLTVADLQEILGLSPNTIRAMCQRGELPALQFVKGRKWYVPKNRLIELMGGGNRA